MKRLAPTFFLLAAATQATTPDRLDWRWDRDTPMCALQQTSESGDVIEINRTPTDDQTEVEIIRRPGSAAPWSVRTEKGLIALNRGRAFSADVYAYPDQWQRPHLVAIAHDPTFFKQMTTASALSISSDTVGKFETAVRSGSAAAASLQQCEDQKMRSWGIDPVAWRGMQAHPMPLKPISELMSAFDYPGMAAAYDVTGNVIARLDVTSDGRVKDCKALNPGKYNGFEMATCAALRGAKFQPGRDSAGNPAPAPFITLVSFRMQ